MQKHGNRFENLVGIKSGRLTVVEYSHNQNKKAYWKCVCDCGGTAIVCACHLKDGHTKSCGCLKPQVLRDLHKTHGMSKTRIHNIWQSMIQRCEYVKSNRFKNYGGRGIKVCKEWHNSVIFIKWAMGNGYQNNLTIDRINNDGNYEQTNCHWITLSENSKKSNAERRIKAA